MKRTRAQLKAELMQELEATVEALLDWHEGTPVPTLTQIEDEVLQLRRAVGQRMSVLVLADQEAKQPVQTPGCPRCGTSLHYKGQKATQVGSRVGELALERGYYHCARCGGGFFPPRPAA
jgi:ribosomal protein S27AE